MGNNNKPTSQGNDYHEVIKLLHQQVVQLSQQVVTQASTMLASTTVSQPLLVINYNALLYDASPGQRLNRTNYTEWSHQLRSALVG
jgi:hypothetical protein